MNTTTTAVGAIRRLERPECTALALLEFHRVGELLATLDDVDLRVAGDCLPAAGAGVEMEVDGIAGQSDTHKIANIDSQAVGRTNNMHVIGLYRQI